MDTETRDGADFLRAIADAGYRDSLVLSAETAGEVLTPERLRVLEAVDEGADSIRSLARSLSRDPGAVKRDLDVLERHGVVEYTEADGRKAPRLRHENVFVEPLLSR